MTQFARNQEHSAFQFGAFELDPHSGELRKHGIKLKLQHQPVRILAILLEHCNGITFPQTELKSNIWMTIRH